MILPYRFISLDLETTGLSPETDTIIEIAAIAFRIEKNEDGTLDSIDLIEKTMLIDPDRPLLEEVTMITGITESMLARKPKWDEVRERVRVFFEEENTIIVGHNVLFDTAMLKTHGIDITHLPTLDTFELSEMLSQDQASLNLGFLSDAYGLSSDGIEHRALGDTRLAMKLFMKYLRDIESLPLRKQSILWLMAEKEETPSIQVLCDILSIWREKEGYILAHVRKEEEKENIRNHDLKGKTPWVHILRSIWADPTEEHIFLRDILEQHPTVTILTMEKKTAEYLYKLVQSWGISVIQAREVWAWISFEELAWRLQEKTWERKLTIMMGKLLFWLEGTTTGLLEELKFYSKEHELLPWFRMQGGETNVFYNEYQTYIKTCRCILSDVHTFESHPIDTLVIKDIPILEEKIRRKRSIRIDIELIISYLEEMSESDATTQLIDAIRLIEWIYHGIPERPQWEQLFPPGEHGETYFISQELLWHRGYRWLSQATLKLNWIFSEWKKVRICNNRHDLMITQYIDTSLEQLLEYHRFQEKNKNTILSIQKWKTVIHIIERDICDGIERDILSTARNIYSYGYGVWWPIIQNFLKTESWISCDNTVKQHSYERELIFQGDISHIDGWSIILTTSLRHIRELGIIAKKTGKKILMQGISWGKWKMISIFEKDPENTIIVGLIDTWRDEYHLWSMIQHVVIAKVPFDPPTDPYYLSRTVGMKNNFALYSEPMVIIRMNTLIGRIRSGGFIGKILCSDDRILISEWGKSIIQELL
jgi:DNA polymerase III epsilon subunit-like protein